MDKSFVLVSQFRPALYFGASALSKNTIDPSRLGNCYELCAGLLDDPKRSKEQVMVDEIREELGYDVKVKDLQFIGRSPGSVGMSGARMYMYYTEKFSGGGLKEEGEQINEKRVPLEEIDAFIEDYNQEKSAAIIMGVYWWKQHMAAKYMK